MKTGEEYLEDLKAIRPLVYALGERLDDPLNHPLTIPVINAARATYDLALSDEGREWLVGKSPLTGKECNRLSNLHTSTEDLVQTVKLRRWWQNTIGSCNGGRCAGMCAANALYNATYMADQELNTDYHQRFIHFLTEAHEKDEIFSAGVMCVKGDRGLGPCDQEDPDMYLRIIDKNEHGIVVRGAKAHQSNAAFAHETLVLPLRAMGEREKQYAVSFAVRNGTRGIIHIWQHNVHDSRRLVAQDIDLGNKQFGAAYHGTSLMIFDDVLIPWERVFLCEEYQFTTPLVDRFADMVRLCGGGCRPGVVDLAIGAMALVAEYNGVGRAGHIVDKLTDLAFRNELGFSAALAAAVEGYREVSGLYFPNPLLANAARLAGSYNFARANELFPDICGGLITTLPSEKDFINPETRPFLEKYLKGKATVPTENRLRAFRFAESLAAGPPLHGLVCGGGTPETQKMFIRRYMDLEGKKGLVKKLAGIKD